LIGYDQEYGLVPVFRKLPTSWVGRLGSAVWDSAKSNSWGMS